MAPNGGWFEQAKVADAEKARLEAEDCGRLIEVTRMEMGWTQARLAEAAGVTETDVAQFEAGQVYPIEPAFSQYLRALGRMS